jgi:hypothetical protein
VKLGEVVVLAVCVGGEEGYDGRAIFVGQERGIYGGQARHSPAPSPRAEMFILRQTASCGKAQTWQMITHIGDVFLTKVSWGSKLRLQRTQ